jgi:CheY-like chemotaxis protein
MDGLEATKLIRGELGMNDLPVIALTGELSADIRSECDDIGFDEFYSKPLKKEMLEKIVKKYKSMRDGFEL